MRVLRSAVNRFLLSELRHAVLFRPVRLCEGVGVGRLTCRSTRERKGVQHAKGTKRIDVRSEAVVMHVVRGGMPYISRARRRQGHCNSAPEWGNIPPSIHILVSIKVGSIDTWDSRSSSQRNHSQDDGERQPRKEQWHAASPEPPQPVRGPSPGVPPSCAARGATTLRSRRSPWLAGRSTTKSVTPCS